MVSAGKQFDIEIRGNMLEMTKFYFERGDTENAKYYGQKSADLKKRIENHDYTEEDKIRNRVDSLTREFERLCK